MGRPQRGQGLRRIQAQTPGQIQKVDPPWGSTYRIHLDRDIDMIQQVDPH